MPRSPRQTSQSGIYHVTMRGNAKAAIFEIDKHRWHFLELLERYRNECCFSILAWCLMDNHVHLILSLDDVDISTVVQKIETAYAVYYNRIEERVGHLFQCPFRSKPIEYEEQLINTIRYIHKNPERVSICDAQAYKWSSYHEYATEPWLIDDSVALGIVGSRDALLTGPIDSTCVVREETKKTIVCDAEAQKMLSECFGVQSLSKIATSPKSVRNGVINKAYSLGFPAKQIARLLGIGERTVYRIVQNVAMRQRASMRPIKVAKGV